MITTISALPEPPNRNNPATFSDKADALLGAMPTLVTELNSFVSEVNTLSFKTACRVATTTAITLSGTQTIDGQNIVAGDRVLVKNQNTSSQNGIYTASSNAWTRAPDMDSVAEVAGSFVPITYGNTNGGKIFYTTFNATGAVLNTTDIPWNSLTEGSITGVGTLAVANGGTGLSSYAVGDLIYASGTTTLVKLAAAASGNVLKSGTAPSWGKVGLTTDVTGTLPVASGGTGQTTAANAFDALKQNATDAVTGVVELATSAEIRAGTDTSRAITPAALRAEALVRDTAKTSTSGTTVEFTGIPSWAKRVTVMFRGVSTNGSSSLQIQIGTSSGFVTSGYAVVGSSISSAGAGSVDASSGFVFSNGNIASTSVLGGTFTLCQISGNTWVGEGRFGDSGRQFMHLSSGSIAAAAALDRVRVTTVNGTDAFDAGTINIMYE